MTATSPTPDPVRNGPHDLGGALGFGPIDRTPDRLAYPEGWEGRCIGLIVGTMATGTYGVDEWRAKMEELPASAQFAMGYYRRWAHALERCLLVHDVLTPAEVLARTTAVARGDAPTARGHDPALMATVETLLREGGPLIRAVDDRPRFAPGDAVRTRRITIDELGEQHTRLPGYAQEREGIVERVYPAMTLPDAAVRGEDRAEHLYAVSFASTDLWADADPAVRVSADLFQSYLDAPEMDR